MALGDIKSPDFKIKYGPKASGYTTPAAGDIVYFDANGEIAAGSTTSLGKHGILSALTKVDGATTLYGVIVEGRAVCKAGGAIKPNHFVMSDANLDAVAVPTTITATYVQAESQRFYRFVGRYLNLEGGDPSNPVDAANTNSIVVEVGGAL